jgi:TolA-binding protein
MKKSVKIALYIVLSITTCVFGYLSYTQYNRIDNALDEAKSAPSEVPALQPKPVAGGQGYARFLTYGACFVISVLILAVILANDVSQFVGNRFLKAAYGDESETINDPDYEFAEQQWADGQHLEAIRLMREYLQKNPREQHVALRIAEIYEKDLQNNLAAALEYEEVLKEKLSPERWGWAAIHLCNLYFKLNHTDKAVDLLRRIDSEYPETAAAEKARKRLALYDSGGDVAPEEGQPSDETPTA